MSSIIRCLSAVIELLLAKRIPRRGKLQRKRAHRKKKNLSVHVNAEVAIASTEK